jgi:prepilin-type N-terminal cleavage/methylation domain-containing protein
MRRRRGSGAGFTLIEALVVVAIIGIVVAVSIPSLRRARMRASMLDVVRTFEQAAAVSRINAIKRGQNVCLRVLNGSNRQQLSTFRAWMDANENEVEDPGEELVGSWQIRNVDEWSFESSSSDPLYILNAAGGGTDRGVVYFPNGMALSRAGGQVGIGQGAFEYYIWYDTRKWNRFQLSIFAGAGTVVVEMWNPAGTGSWSDNFAHWEYY